MDLIQLIKSTNFASTKISSGVKYYVPGADAVTVQNFMPFDRQIVDLKVGKFFVSVKVAGSTYRTESGVAVRRSNSVELVPATRELVSGSDLV